jgi:hypothetical protein
MRGGGLAREDDRRAGGHDDRVLGVLAVNHSGDSDSTGAIAGNILGTLHGEASIPAAWLEELELRDVVAEVADDLADAFYGEGGGDEYGPYDERVNRWLARYPGG